MRYLVGFVLFLLALGSLRTVGCGNDCYWDSDCDDGNPCTLDDCEYYFRGPYEGFSFCGPEFHACSYMRVDDGAPCEADEQSGSASLDGVDWKRKHPSPVLMGAFEVPP